MSEKRKHKRVVHSYLKPKNYMLLTGYAEINEMSRSRVVNMAVKCFFDTLPTEIKERVVKYGNQ